MNWDRKVYVANGEPTTPLRSAGFGGVEWHTEEGVDRFRAGAQLPSLVVAPPQPFGAIAAGRSLTGQVVGRGAANDDAPARACAPPQ